MYLQDGGEAASQPGRQPASRHWCARSIAPTLSKLVHPLGWHPPTCLGLAGRQTARRQTGGLGAVAAGHAGRQPASGVLTGWRRLG